MSDSGKRPKRDLAALARRIFLPLALLLALAKFLSVVHEHYPIQQWIFWVYARCWILSITFAVSCICAGNVAIARLVGTRSIPFRERLIYSFGAGIIIFYVLMSVGGFLGLFRTPFALVPPLLMIAAGGVPTFRLFRRYLRKVIASRASWRPLPWWVVPMALFGAVGLGMLYFAILSPRNAAFDAHFYHLGIPQQYIAEGGIYADPVGWWPTAQPHLASMIYTWAYLIPGSNFVHIVVSAHLEFTIFIGTLCSIPVLVRYLAPGSRTGLAWAAMFLFPKIFLYDSSPIVAADHIAAFWAVPTWLAFRRAYKELDVRYCALLSVVLAGALLTKYSSVVLLALPALGIVFRMVWLNAFREKRSHNWIAGPLTALIVGLVLTSPHWGKNWLFYGDPMYPYLHSVFGDRWHPDALYQFTHGYAHDLTRWKPVGETLREKLWETAWAVYTFSFEPHDWPKYHGKVPIFGSLFTLSILVLPFLRRTKRVWMVFIAANLGVFIWYYNLHQDRYLQVLLPWMAACVACVIILAWSSHIFTRAALILLVGAQIIWGGDVYFFGTHAMTHKAPTVTTSALLATGFNKKYKRRFVVSGALFAVGEHIPKGSRVVLHEHNPRLGLNASVIADYTPWQFGLRYGRLASPRAMYDKLKELGVTHIVWRSDTKSRYRDSLAGDLRFWEFVNKYVKKPKKIRGWLLAEMLDKPPEGPFNDVVAYLGCKKIYKRGLHKLDNLNMPARKPPPSARFIPGFAPTPPTVDELPPLIAKAGFVVTHSKCHLKVPPKMMTQFKQIAKRHKETLWMRK